MSSSYRDALKAISARTGAPLSSLIVSFAVLHEITAIAPLVGIFYAARGLHLGERVVAQAPPWASEWIDDGERWVDRVGRRYGLFGLDTATPVASDVANAVLAYAATKALLPVRIGLSLYLSPALSRAVRRILFKKSCRSQQALTTGRNDPL